MNPVEELKTEHRAIELALAILEKLLETIQAPNSTAAASDAVHLVDFFRTFVDTCHHGKEEGFLFPELEQLGVSREGGPIGVMLSEHDLGRMHTQDMDNAAQGLASRQKNAAKAFQSAAEAYIDLLRRHIDKEDNVLFEIAASRLPSAKMKQLSKDFERLEKEKIGPNRHEEYHALLDGLEAKYLRQIKSKIPPVTEKPLKQKSVKNRIASV